MTRACRFASVALAVALLALLAAPALAQVPQDTSLSGRLVDDLGQPLAGPVDLTLRVFDVPGGGTELYAEQHLGTPVDAAGSFAVQLGLGSSPSGTFDAALFSEADRWVEVVVGSDLLTPRLPIAAVPWALAARQANAVVLDPSAPRFEDCGDGTVADHQTGLLWEQKTGTAVAGPVVCATTACPDPHDVNNYYTWSATGTAADGLAFTEFLAALNDPTWGFAATANDVTGCFAGYCDWRLPDIAELNAIRDCSFFVGMVQACIDPTFGPVGLDGIGFFGIYWSSLTHPALPDYAWFESFALSIGSAELKTRSTFVRAVRSGSCR